MAFGSSGILIILKPMTDLLRFSLLSSGDFLPVISLKKLSAQF
jgi:hypothetical protein